MLDKCSMLVEQCVICYFGKYSAKNFSHHCNATQEDTAL
jgi:hypothetical protein